MINGSCGKDHITSSTRSLVFINKDKNIKTLFKIHSVLHLNLQYILDLLFALHRRPNKIIVRLKKNVRVKKIKVPSHWSNW
jgi:hypothetical protein